MFAITTWLMARSASLASTGLSSLLVMSSRNSASTDWCFILAQRTTSKSNFDKRKRQYTSRPVEVTRLCIK